MTISGILNGYFQAQAVANMQTQLGSLQTELSSGEKSSDYAGIGNDRSLGIALQSQVAAAGNYGNVMTNVSTRLSIAQQALTQIGTSTNQVASSTLNSQFGPLNQNGQTVDQQTASGQLQQVLDSLNTQVGTSYLFSGTASNTPSVASASTILNGSGSQAGLNQVISERAQADLGSNGLGRLVIPSTSAAHLIGTGATLSPDVTASMTGSQDISALASAGGTLVINGHSVTINAGDNAAAIVTDINAQTGTTGVTASLGPNNHLVLAGATASTAVTIGNTSTGSLLTEVGLTASTANPVNLLTQGAVTSGDQLVLGVGSNPATTITFGTGPGQISTLAGLNSALAGPPGVAGGIASVNTANGNISVTALDTTSSITTAFTGVGPVTNFGIAAGTTAPGSGTRVSLSEDVAGSVFGLKIASVASTLTGATVAGPTGAPANTTVDLGSNPNAGDTLTYNFNLPDGTTQALTLTATTTSPPAAGQFTIGATPAATATNLQAALTSSVSTLAASSLTAASAVAAANEFFSSNPPQRVNGPPFATATSLIAGTSQNTVDWYTGENGGIPARSTASAQIDPSTSVSFGMRANEPALTNSVENIALFSAMTFSASDPNAKARYEALTQRISTNMNIPSGSQTVTSIETDITSSQTAIKTATTDSAQTTATLQNMIQSIEGASSYDVSEQILNMQTRLQASLQVTAMLSKVNLATLL